LLIPGYCAVVFAGTKESGTGNVTGSLADGLTSPNKISAIAFPVS